MDKRKGSHIPTYKFDKNIVSQSSIILDLINMLCLIGYDGRAILDIIHVSA